MKKFILIGFVGSILNAGHSVDLKTYPTPNEIHEAQKKALDKALTQASGIAAESLVADIGDAKQRYEAECWATNELASILNQKTYFPIPNPAKIANLKKENEKQLNILKKKYPMESNQVLRIYLLNAFTTLIDKLKF